MSAKEFASDIDTGLDEYREKIATVISLISLDLVRGITLKTPVDTGRAIGNWDTTIGAPGGNIYGEDKTGASSINRAVQAMAAYRAGDALPVIWIANNLPYIERLENGYSDKASNGMVAITLAEVSAKYADVEI